MSEFRPHIGIFHRHGLNTATKLLKFSETTIQIPKYRKKEGVSGLRNALKSPEIIRRGGTRAFSNIQFSETYYFLTHPQMQKCKYIEFTINYIKPISANTCYVTAGPK